MPKLFPLEVEVEEVAVGRVMRLLHKTAGVAKVNLRMDEGPKKPNGHARPRGSFEITGRDFVRQLLAKGIQKRPELAEEFSKAGRSPASISSSIDNDVRDGFVKTDGHGTYSLTKKGRDSLRRHKVKKS